MTDRDVLFAVIIAFSVLVGIATVLGVLIYGHVVALRAEIAHSTTKVVSAERHIAGLSRLTARGPVR